MHGKFMIEAWILYITNFVTDRNVNNFNLFIFLTEGS